MTICLNPNCLKPQNRDQSIFCQNCGSELLLVGRYRVINLLSNKGGFAKTYEIIHKDVSKVLKVLIDNNPKGVELFTQEAELLSQLNHPGIPKGEDFFAYFPKDYPTPLYCLVMEKIEGMDLEEYQRQRQYIPIEDKLAIEWLIQLTEILQEVHSQNFFHRDIKPSNIILQPNGQLVLIDFGAARQVTKTILAGNQNTGIYTPGYAPPEQEKGYAVPQSDFFALGRTFVYLLTGKEPTDVSIYDHYNNELNWRKSIPKINRELADFIDELIAEKANQRPKDTTIILKRLADINNHLSYPLKWFIARQNSQKTLNKNKLPLKYADFWMRFNAAFIDQVILIIIAYIAGRFTISELYKLEFLSAVGFKLPNISNMAEVVEISAVLTSLGTNVIGLILGVIVIVSFFLDGSSSDDYLSYLFSILFLISLGSLVKWLYFTNFEYFCQGTIGKIILGIKVTNNQGKKISFAQANQRYWSKSLSLLTLYIGFVMVVWTKKKTALHDLIARTIVLKKDD